MARWRRAAVVLALGGLALAHGAEDGGPAEAAARRAALERARSAAADAAAAAASVRGQRLQVVLDLEARGHLEQAVDGCRLLARDLPGDAEIEALHGRLLGALHERRRTAHRDLLEHLREEVALRTSLEMLPTGHDGWPRFPADWDGRSRRRAAAGGPPVEPWRQALQEVLSQRVSFDAGGLTGAEALALLGERHRLNLAIDPAVAAASAEPLALRAPSIRLDHLISWIARSMGTGWSMAAGGVWIGAEALAAPALEVHDIASLLRRAADQPERTIALASAGGSGGGGASSPFSAAEPSQAQAPFTAEEVVDLVRGAVSPATWERPGCGMTVRGSALYVTAPAEVHALVREFLRAQGRQQSLQVRIEARWVEVQDRFLEEVGVDWTRSGSMFQTVSGSGAAVENGRGGIAGTTANILPATAMSISPATAGTGLNLGALVLDRVQAGAMLSAVQRRQKARLLESLSVVTLNGVRANIFAGTQDAYVASYQITNNNYDPDVEVVSGGLDLSVRPLVSADRKYVTMELRPSMAVVRFATETIRGNRIYDVGTGDGGTAAVVSTTYAIGLPTIELRAGATTAIIPDRGSLLVGGFNRSLDQTARTRVPYLGSIPYLGRLFSRRGRYSDHDRLFLIATATIIAYDELETKL